MASVTPFGQTGPRANWKGPDIVTWAMGGYMWMTGEPGRAPLRISHPPQAFLHASAMAAVGCLMALHYRAATGMGQHVDVSAQQCPSWMLTNTYAYWDLMKQNLSRGGVLRHFGNIHLKTVWPARDGHVSFMFAGGSIGAKGQRRIAELMGKEGMAEDWLRELNWDQLDAFNAEQAQIDRISEAFSRLFAAKEKAWLLEEAVKGGIMLGPINTVADVVHDPQLEARDFWTKVDHPELGAAIDYPGAPVKMSKTPWRIRGRAPGIGQHNADIFGKELGLSQGDLARLEEMEVI
jgi:crotonobetainyl-CoA:carnitine CoA-transferase CaiB-like acyl-CoA transferase